jgi:hypothetical protein
MLDPPVQKGRPGTGNRLSFVATVKVLVEEFAAVGEPQRCLSELVGRQTVVVDLHVDLASVQRAAEQGHVNALHALIFAGRPGGALVNREMLRKQAPNGEMPPAVIHSLRGRGCAQVTAA